MPIATQTLYNPYTKQYQVIDLTAPDAHAQIAQLYQQGWTVPSSAGVAAPTPAQITQAQTYQAQRHEQEVAGVQYAQKVQAARVAIQEREKIKTPEQIEAEKPAIPQDWWDKLGPGAQKHFRIAPEVTSEVYSKLGEGAKSQAELKQSTWQKVTPWKEEEGQKATTANSLIWGAEIIIPGVREARHWNEMSNLERGTSIFLDALCVASFAGPGVRLASRLSSEATSGLRTVYNSRISAALRTQVANLSKAETASQVIKAGRNVEAIGQKIKATGGAGADILIARGKAIQQNAAIIIKQPIDTSGLVKPMRAIVRDQRGGLSSIARDEARIIAKRLQLDTDYVMAMHDFAVRYGLKTDEIESLLAKYGDNMRVYKREVERIAIESGRYKPLERQVIPQKQVEQAKPKLKVAERTKIEEVIRKELPRPEVKPEIAKKHSIARKIEEQVRKQAKVWADAKAVAEAKRANAVRLTAKEIAAIAAKAAQSLGLSVRSAAATEVVDTYIDVYTRAITAGKAVPKAKEEALAAVHAKAQEVAQTETKVSPYPVPKPKEEVVVVPKVEPKPDTKTQPAPKTETAPAPKTPQPKGTGNGDGGKGQRRKKPGGSDELQIERVEGISAKPGIVSYKDGIVQVEIVPPYREGPEDIHYARLKEPQKGKGSQESTLKVTGGRAPSLVVLSRGVTKTHIYHGKRMSHTRQRGPGILTSGGGFRRQKRGSVI